MKNDPATTSHPFHNHARSPPGAINGALAQLKGNMLSPLIIIMYNINNIREKLLNSDWLKRSAIFMKHECKFVT